MSNDLGISIIGYTAAVITNISVYPQAYEVYIIIDTNEYDKLNGLSLTMYALQTSGCFIWLTYSSLLGLYPIIFGSIFCIIPSLYIIYGIIMYRQTVMPEGITRDQFIYDEQPRQNNDNTEIVVASGSSYNITEVTI